MAKGNLKRKRDKCSKGLRHFSMKVCEKVKQKGATTYNQVADELVAEYCNSSTDVPVACSELWTHDQKNVRRRVYDALNVLMAMKIISKEKKEIRWIGLPFNRKQECADLEVKKKQLEVSVDAKCDELKDLLIEVKFPLFLVCHNFVSFILYFIYFCKRFFNKCLLKKYISAPFGPIYSGKKPVDA